MARSGSTAVRLGALTACSFALSSCLVTDRVEFGEPPIPSIVTPLSPDPNAIGRVPTQADGDCDGTTWMRFEASVADANVDDTLYGRFKVNGGEQDAVRVFVIPTTGAVLRDGVVRCLRQESLANACSRVELQVSADPTFSDEADISRALWWVLGLAQDYPRASPSDCGVLTRDGGVL